jgi:hypothetical protein
MRWIGFLFFVGFSSCFSVLAGDCTSIHCPDPCSHSRVELMGDRCSVTWDSKRKCFAAYAECKDSKKCFGALCYDGCTGIDRYFKKANTCYKAFDASALCWRAYARCE